MASQSNTSQSLANVQDTSANSPELAYAELLAKYESLKTVIAQLSMLGDAAVVMMNQESLENLLEYISTEIIRLTGAKGAYLHMVHETGDYLQVVAASGAFKDQLMGSIRTRGKGLSARAWESGKYEYTDAYNKAYGNEIVEFPTEVKAVSIPLSFSDHVFGVAFITAPLDEDLKSQIPMLKEITKVASISIFYTKQLEAQTKELRRIETLSKLGDTLYQSTNWDSTLQKVSQHLIDIFDVERVTIYHNPNNTDSLQTHSAYRIKNGDFSTKEQKVEALSQHSISYWCFDNIEFAQINRNTDDPRESKAVHEYRRKHNIGSTMCVPICFDKKPWGVIIITKNVDKCDFNENDANTFQAMASQLSTALQRNDLLSKVHHQAYHDSLTNLPNRRRFKDRFSEIVDSAAQEPNAISNKPPDKKQFAIMFCDLDGFKAVNDAHGHNIGDQVIKICTQRMKKCTREGDCLARMGGDEFALMVQLKNHEYGIDELAKRFADSIAEPIHIRNLRINMGISIGISFYADDGFSFSELLNHADIAMYQAKHAGEGKIKHFNKLVAEKMRSKSELGSLLPVALARNEFELWYQPQVCLKSGTVTGVEALIRWNSAERGMVSPFEFIPLAEESGFIDELGYWIMEEAIRTLKSWQFSAEKQFSMSVNIATPQFNDPNFSDTVIKLLKLHDVSPSQLKAEITESFIMNNRESVVVQLKVLREAGINIALDDFGTGYSSLSYLQDLPVDILKIDRSFVKDLTTTNFEKSIAASIIALANSLDLSTVAEGIETKEQLGLIEILGCDLIQGYYYSKPVLAAELPDVVGQIESELIECADCFKKSA